METSAPGAGKGGAPAAAAAPAAQQAGEHSHDSGFTAAPFGEELRSNLSCMMRRGSDAEVAPTEAQLSGAAPALATPQAVVPQQAGAWSADEQQRWWRHLQVTQRRCCDGCASDDGALRKASSFMCCAVCGYTDSATNEQPIYAQLSRWELARPWIRRVRPHSRVVALTLLTLLPTPLLTASPATRLPPSRRRASHTPTAPRRATAACQVSLRHQVMQPHGNRLSQSCSPVQLSAMAQDPTAPGAGWQEGAKC